MSLLDDVSIVVTPNGYKAGELYAVIPVPTEGAELVEDGSFPSGTSNWSEGTGWSLIDGYANASSASGELSQSGIDFDTSKRYYIQYTISGYSGSGGVKARFKGAVWNTGELREENGTFTEVLMSTAENTVFSFVTSSSFTGSISNVSVKEYTSADMDVTRATAATRVDENGLVNYAEVLGGEEVTNGDFATDSDWIKDTGWTISGGQAHCDGTDGAQFRTVNSPLTDGKTYYISYQITSYTSGSIDVLGQSFYGISGNSVTTVTGIFVATKPYVRFYSSAFTGSIDNVSVKEVTRDNVPRIDYTGGGCPHILAEPQRTNLIQYSEDFTDTYWTSTTDVETPVKSTTIKSPDGNYNAWHIVKDGSNSKIAKVIGSSSVEYSKSIWARTISGSGTAYFGNGSISSGVLTTVTTEWQRIEITSSVDNFYAVDFRGSSTLTEVLIWGAQMEEGSYPTSYIPTSGSTVTRNQDIFTRDGIGSLINSTEGVLFVEMAALSNDSTNRQLTLSDGTDTNRIVLKYDNQSNIIQSFNRVSGVETASLSATVSDITQFSKIAIKYKLNDYAMWIDGVEVDTDNSSTTFPSSTLNKLSFGTSSSLFAKVKQLQVYDTALTDEQLLQLTGESGTDFYESYAEMASALTYTIQ